MKQGGTADMKVFVLDREILSVKGVLFLAETGRKKMLLTKRWRSVPKQNINFSGGVYNEI